MGSLLAAHLLESGQPLLLWLLSSHNLSDFEFAQANIIGSLTMVPIIPSAVEMILSFGSCFLRDL